jgi:glycosyltransferase involved in cell wall biosynthesis
VFHYHGCDVRNRAHMRATHAHSTCTECEPPFCIPARQRRILRKAEHHAAAEIVSTPDLLESAPRAMQMHVAVWLADYPVAPLRDRPRLVLHAPTHRLIKGTPYVERAFAALRPRFPDVEFKVVEKLPWIELRRLMAECDVFVDQLHMGWYGMVSAEAMAMGKPTLAYIRPDFEARMQDAPVVRTSVGTLEADLAALLADAPRRRDLGGRGRAYVEREHEAHVIAARLVALYRSLGVT